MIRYFIFRDFWDSVVKMNSITPAVIAVIAIAMTMSTVPSAYSHGLGEDTITIPDIAGRDITITGEMPKVFQDDAGYIKITAKDGDDPVRDLTLRIGLYQNDELILRNHFFAADGVLLINIPPYDEEDNFVISGVQDSRFGAWYETEQNRLQISNPGLSEGGLYKMQIEIITIDTPNNIIENSEIKSLNISVVETSTHIERNTEFITKSHYSKIFDFDYEPRTRQITYEMLFEWGEEDLLAYPNSEVRGVHTKRICGIGITRDTSDM